MRFAKQMLLVVLVIASLSPAFAVKNNKNVILISCDGVQREHLKECLSKNELPNLAALIKEGNLVDIDVTHTTDTKAGHSQMLTGYDPEVTGVYSNGKFKPIPAGYSVFERLESTLGADKITTVMLTSKTHHIGNCPPAKPVDPATLDPGYFPGKDNPSKLAEPAKSEAKESTDTSANPTTLQPESGTSTPDAPKPRRAKRNAANRNQNAATTAKRAAGQNKEGEPWFLVYKNIDVWDGEKARTADITGPLALGYLDKYSKDRFFMFFHFADPDTVGHKSGENSTQENDAYILCDKWLGDIVAKLKALGIYDKTLIYVNSDHGFNEDAKGHKNAPTVFLATNDKKVISSGNQRDIVPTICTEMGVDYTKFEPKLTGKSLTEK